MLVKKKATDPFGLPNDGEFEIDGVHYFITREDDLRWRVSIQGLDIARIRKTTTGWRVYGMYDNRESEECITLDAALTVASYRY